MHSIVSALADNQLLDKLEFMPRGMLAPCSWAHLQRRCQKKRGGFDNNCPSSFDDNTCKRYNTTQYGCADHGCSCSTCPPGPRGPAGPQGPAGGVLGFADFYALMPPDNADTVAPGTDVSFPQDGPTSGTSILRAGPDSFTLTDIGTYQVLFHVSVTEAGQLILTLNGEDLDYTVAGRATGTSQIVGIALVETTTENAVLTVRNPEGTAEALTITPLAGGTRPVSAHLTITQLQ